MSIKVGQLFLMIKNIYSNIVTQVIKHMHYKSLHLQVITYVEVLLFVWGAVLKE